jgi:two-component system chemotaxis response regulator CheY
MSDALNILIVDDEPSVTKSLVFVLSGPKRTLTSAADGEEALAKMDATACRFDVVLTDNNMPRISGIEFVRALRARNFGGKILVLSAHLSEENTHAYQELSVDTLMPKPFDIGELRRAIDALAKAA